MSDLSLSEILAFKLDAEECGIDILGVVNLRGVNVPIVDMRLKFKLSPVNYDSFTVVIVLNIGTRVVGMVVDGDAIAQAAVDLLLTDQFTICAFECMASSRSNSRIVCSTTGTSWSTASDCATTTWATFNCSSRSIASRRM